MEALAATSAAPTAPPVQAVRPEAAPASVAAPAPAQVSSEPLPALPAALQRQQIEMPEPKLMTREQMAALLALATG